MPSFVLQGSVFRVSCSHRMLSVSANHIQKHIKLSKWKSLVWQRRLPQSTTAGGKEDLNLSDELLSAEKSKTASSNLNHETFNTAERLLEKDEVQQTFYPDAAAALREQSEAQSLLKSKTIDSVIDNVTPCPIEAQDGNLSEQQVVTEALWKRREVKLSELPSLYLQLSKSRLTGLVVVSALAGYGMAPGTFNILTCALMGAGTFLSSCSANTINQYFEVPYDSQMSRTRNRVLVKGTLSPLHAVGFASVAGGLGVCTLYHMVNPLAAAISASTWLLYVSAYTPLKRVSIVNTWVGAVVGGLPPMIGWAACMGSLDAGAFLMAGFLYCWQFPHFNALSWNLRSDYSRGGYCMMATTDPGLCRRVALRHCLGIIGLSTLAPMLDLTTWAFAIDSLPLNVWFSYLGWRFYRDGDSKSARRLFMFSLLHLPLLMLLLLISKKSLYHTEKKPKVKVTLEDAV